MPADTGNLPPVTRHLSRLRVAALAVGAASLFAGAGTAPAAEVSAPSTVASTGAALAEQPGQEGEPGQQGDPEGEGEPGDEGDPGGDTPSGEGEDREELTDDNCPIRDGEELTGTPWERTRLQYDRVHELSTGRGVIIAVVDTGVNFGSYQLGGLSETGEQMQPRTSWVYGTSLPYDTGNEFTDCDGHGTFVAGVIAAQPRPENDMLGLAPRATIYPARYAYGQLDPESESDADVLNMAQAVDAAVRAGAQVINISSASPNNVPDLERAINYALENDVVVVAAAGNTGNAGNPVTYPAAYDGVIAVAAVDEAGQVPETSQTSVPISVSAPGVQVTGPTTGYGLTKLDGTSFAAPIVAATAALIRARYPDLGAADVKRRIELTADHPGRNVPDERYGWGVVNPYEALTAVLPPESEQTAEPTTAPAGPTYTPPTPPDPAPRRNALIVAALAAGTVTLMFIGVGAYRRGQRRRWRAGQESGPTEADTPPALTT